MVQTARIVLVVAALGTAALMWSLSGAGGLYGATDPAGDLSSGDEIEDRSNESAVVENGSFDGSAEGANSDSIVGLIVSGTGAITDFAGMVALLPFELQRLGMPYWAAYPLGVAAQAIVGIGIVQFAAGRVYR